MFLSGRIISRAESRYFKSSSTVYLSVWCVWEGVYKVDVCGVEMECERGGCGVCSHCGA